MNIPKIIIDINTGCNTCGKSLITIPAAGGCGCVNAQIPCTDTTPNSPCNDCETVCEDAIFTDCMFYSAGDIAALGLKHDDRLTKIIITLAAEIISLKQRVLILEEG